jgi:enoyl-[acyl-carrier protein] reductase I
MPCSNHKRLALVMGVGNHRSIAWACVQSLLQRNYDCIVTYQSDRFAKPVQKLIDAYESASAESNNNRGRILGAVACNVETDIPKLVQEDVPQLLLKDSINRKLDSIVHSIAYCDMKDPRLSQATWPVYAQAMHISAYSFLELARCAVESNLLHSPNDNDTADSNKNDSQSPPLVSSSSLIAMTYLGAVRAAPNYQCMGPAKAALEATVRGIAAEYGHLHVNAVSAGPIATLSARGIRDFSVLQNHVSDTAPLRRSVTAREVAAAVAFLAEQTGITGQTIYVDAGYSSVVPVAL